MHLVHMDDEGRDLLEAGMEMAHAALMARARRVDPEGVLSMSANMSRIKTRDVLKQLRMGPLAAYLELPAEKKDQFENLCNLMLSAETDDVKATIYDAIKVIVFTRVEGMFEDTETIRQTGGDLSPAALEDLASFQANRAANMRRVQKQKSD